MGWFSCDHKWESYQDRHTLFGKSINRHKCTKCGKVEDCNKYGTRIDSDGYSYHACGKCGNYNF
ncbi:MAG: hypothetical protein WC755_09360 [Candidatus Woesearchaeota archaeon]